MTNKLSSLTKQSMIILGLITMINFESFASEAKPEGLTSQNMIDGIKKDEL